MSCLRILFILSLTLNVLAIECTGDQVYFKYYKQSGAQYANEESFEIYSGNSKIFTSPVFANGELRINEHCLSSAVNNQYTIKLKDSGGDSWYSGSWLIIEGEYGNRVFKNMLTDESEEEYTLSLYYAVQKYSSWKMTSGSVTGSWTEYNYNDASWNQVTLGSSISSVSGTQYFRKTFAGLVNMAAYEISLNYRCGIKVYINGIEEISDNMSADSTASGCYSTTSYHSYIRPGIEVTNAQSILAIEVHYMDNEAHDVDFDTYVALMASTVTDDTCFIYPYDVTLTTEQGSNVDNIFDFSFSTAFTATDTQLPTSVTYDLQGAIPFINSIRVWPYTAPTTAPNSFTLQGSTTATTWNDVLTVSNAIYQSNEYHIMSSLFYGNLYNKYRLQITGSSAMTGLNAYEVQPVICSLQIPSTITFEDSPYSFYAVYHHVLIQPSISEFTNCVVTPALPTGLTMDATTCTVTGKSLTPHTLSMYTVTSTMNSHTYTGTFQLEIIECSGTLIDLVRTYYGNAAYEGFEVVDAVSETTVFAVPINSGQISNLEWHHTLCLPNEKYIINTSCTLNYWQPASYLYVNSVLETGDYETIIRIKHDINTGLDTTHTINVRYLVKPMESWFYKMGEVPSNWYGSDTSGWQSSTFGSFPDSTNQIQLYKKTFTVTSLTDVAGIVISLRYQYGVIIYLNNHEAFRIGVTGDLSTSSMATTSLTDANYRQVSLPIRTIRIGDTPSVDYVTTGTNTIAIALVAINPTVKASSFDCSIRLMGDSSVSRTFNYVTTYSNVYGSPVWIFSQYYTISVYYYTCTDNYLQINFDDDRHEWISSVIVKLHYQQELEQPRQFVIKARNNGDSEWTTLRNVTGLTWSQMAQRNRIWLANNKAYNQYRFENFATGNPDVCSWKIGMIDLFSDATTVEVPALSYENTSIYKDIEMAELYPSSDHFTDYTITPALPQGIALDYSTGAISGTATQESALQTYTVSAKKFTGEPVSTQFSLAVEICTGGKSLITLVVRTDNWPAEGSYKLYRGKDTTTLPISQIDKFKIKAALNFEDFCLQDDIYTLVLFDSYSDGWVNPGGYYMSVDVGALKFETGHFPSVANVTNYFSSYLPFQVEYSDWKIYKNTQSIAENWNTIEFDDSTWETVKAAQIGTSEAITVYIRKEMNIPDINDYQVLNVRVKYTGGIVAFFNGRKVARFNLADEYDSQTQSIVIHDANTFSMFHVILPITGGVTGKNVMSFEVHRPVDHSSAEPVVFDATAIFGVNPCSIALDSTSNIVGSTGGSISDLNLLFDLSPETFGGLNNVVNSYVQWTIENLEGTKFNSFAVENVNTITGLGFSLYGRLKEVNEDFLSMFNSVGLTLHDRMREKWSVPAGVASFKQFKWEIDHASSASPTFSSLLFQYCRPTTTGVCPGVGDYPSVAEGEISPGPCDYGFRGYSYRECVDGVLGAVKNDMCDYKIPTNMRYEDRIVLVVNTQSTIAAPIYQNIITEFYLDENTSLPQGLTLDATTGAITGVPTEEMGLKSFTIYGKNPKGVTYAILNLSIRKGECMAEGNFPKTYAGETAVFECSTLGSYVGTQKRTCVLGTKDGEWQKIQGLCMPVAVMIILILIVIIIIAIVVFIVLRITRRKKAVKGVKGKAKTQVPAKGAEKAKKEVKV